MLLLGYKYRIEHIKGIKNVVADTLSRIELLTDSDEDANIFDDKVANINTISDVALDSDLQDRLDHVWAITLGEPTSDNKTDDDEVVETDTQTEDDLDNMSPYDVQQLQNSCPDCNVFLDYFQNKVLPLDNAGARKIVYQSERFILQDGILYHLDLPRQRKKNVGELINQQLIVLRSLRKLILRLYHEGLSHIKSGKMYNSIRRKYD